MLAVKNLGVTYKDQAGRTLEVITDITFTVAEHEFVSIVGPSGAGKTTLLRCMCGLLQPTNGEVRLDGTLVERPLPRLAAVFQDYSRSLMPWYTVARNVDVPLEHKVSSKTKRRARVAAALAAVGLSEFGDRYPWELSGGMQQRVAIARAIAYEPEVMVMDEPFASVDAQTRADLEDLILRVRDEVGTAVVLVTHDIDEAIYVGDRVVVLSGRPAVVVEAADVDCPHPRDQISTKMLRAFVEHRARVLELIRDGNPMRDSQPGTTERSETQRAAVIS